MREPSFAFRIAPEAMLRPLTEAYAKGFAHGRDAGQNALMAGFYVNNNVGIALAASRSASSAGSARCSSSSRTG
jgi:hypothetical protein